MDLWDEYDEQKVSENDRPDYLPVEQRYIALEFNNGGKDMEKFQFSNGMQAFAAWKQVRPKSFAIFGLYLIACSDSHQLRPFSGFPVIAFGNHTHE